MRTIGVVTVARSDYGIYLPVLRRIEQTPGLQLHLIVSGTHLSPEFGSTVSVIEDDGFTVGDRVEMLLSSDTPKGVAMSMGLGTIGFAQSFARARPDVLLVMGDRFEMHAAAVAAVPFKIPVAHIHGGEITEGAFDDALRHSMTKLSHLHFVATKQYRDRVLQMGEQPWRVVVSGAPGLDNIPAMDVLQPSELKAEFNIDVDPRPLLVTFHPVTLEFENTEWHLTELFAALGACGLPVIITQPNADTNGRMAARMMADFAETYSRVALFGNLGTKAYLSLLTHAAAMVGNSSSGVIEAPSFHLPVVNIGTRQQGRIRASNVIDVGYDRDSILSGIKAALDPAFSLGLQNLKNPYGDGRAAGIIVESLKNTPLDEKLLKKRFKELALHDTVGQTAFD